MRSFAELELDPTVTGEELAEVLGDYAKTGAAILSRVVKGIIARTQLSSKQRSWMVSSALLGYSRQTRLGFRLEAEEYLRVATNLESVRG